MVSDGEEHWETCENSEVIGQALHYSSSRSITAHNISQRKSYNSSYYWVWAINREGTVSHNLQAGRMEPRENEINQHPDSDIKHHSLKIIQMLWSALIHVNINILINIFIVAFYWRTVDNHSMVSLWHSWSLNCTFLRNNQILNDHAKANPYINANCQALMITRQE